MKGYAGRILFVDLTTGETWEENLKLEMVKKFIGGRGLAAKLLYDIQKGNTDPFSEENHIIIATGPMTGTPIPSGCKFVLASKSPTTGAFLESYSSGKIAQELKYAGYDALIVKGKSSSPCYLKIENKDVEIKDASNLWGSDTFETERNIKKALGENFGVICIGPAGEKLSLISGINSDFYRQAARAGGGAIFGSKNLKAIAVRGTKQGVSCHDYETILKLQKKHVAQLKESFMGKIRKKYGTPYTLNITNAAGMLPTRNFQTGIFKEAEDMIDAYAVERITIKSKSCLGCVVGCSKITEIKDGPFKDLTFEGPEYETLALMGSNLGINYLPAIIKFNELCDKYGLDTISTGGVIGFAMECYEKGLISKFDTDGRELRFGNYEAVAGLIEDIAYRRGFGDILSSGVKRASERIGQGSEKFAMHVKGLELPAYDPRGSFGGGLTYAVTPRGACHRRCWPAAKELRENSPFKAEGKATMVKKIWDNNTIYHCLLLCDIPPKNIGISLDDICDYFNALTGEALTPVDLIEVADRTETQIRLFNVREGFSRKDDNLPHRILNEPLPEGPAKGVCIGQKNLDTMLNEWYEIRGWDSDGNPKQETIENLGLLNGE